MTKKLCENISKNHENSTCLHDIDFHNILTDIYKIKNLTGVFQIDNKDVVVNAFKVNNLASGKKIISMPFSFIPKMLGESDDINGLKYLINVACTEGSEYYVEYKCFSDLGNNLTIKNKIVTKKNLLINSSLFLKNTYEEQQLEISKNLRQTIRTSNRRAQEEDIVFKKADDIRLVQSFYTMLNNMFKYKHNTISQPFEIFESVYNNFVLKNKADFYLAVKCDKVIAGIVVFKHNDNWTYMWGASDQDYSKINLNTLLVDLLIQDAIKEKAKIIEDTTPPEPKMNTFLSLTSYLKCLKPSSKPAISVL